MAPGGLLAIEHKSRRSLDHIKLRFREQICEVTEDLISKAKLTQLGQQTLQSSALGNLEFNVGDIAVNEITKNLVEY